jgi:hypothetical protein
VTLVHVTEDKEPEKASSPALDAQIRSPSQKDQEVESVLDTELLEVPETQKDSPTNEPGLGEQKEEAPQQEIGISTVNYEKQIEVRPLRHMGEVQEPSLEQIYTIKSLGNMLT